jgi:hypothetical protein
MISKPRYGYSTGYAWIKCWFRILTEASSWQNIYGTKNNVKSLRVLFWSLVKEKDRNLKRKNLKNQPFAALAKPRSGSVLPHRDTLMSVSTIPHWCKGIKIQPFYKSLEPAISCTVPRVVLFPNLDEALLNGRGIHFTNLLQLF